MAKTNITTNDSSTAVATLLALKVGRRGASITNTDANTLYVSVGSTTVGSTVHTAPITNGSLYETPSWYQGEAIYGMWATDGVGGASVTEWL